MGALHLHANAWGLLTADDVTRYADDDTVMEVICELVNSVITGEVDPAAAVSGWGKEGKKEKPHYDDDMPRHAKDVPFDSSRINSAVNHHGPKCRATCAPSQTSRESRQKCVKCRMARPARPMDESKVTEITRDATASELYDSCIMHRWVSLPRR